MTNSLVFCTPCGTPARLSISPTASGTPRSRHSVLGTPREEAKPLTWCSCLRRMASSTLSCQGCLSTRRRAWVVRVTRRARRLMMSTTREIVASTCGFSFDYFIKILFRCRRYSLIQYSILFVVDLSYSLLDSCLDFIV